MTATGPFSKLKAFWGDTKLINIVIETPTASPFKVKFDDQSEVSRVHKAMPLGTVFPFNFGFVPGTKGADGDPVDVLLLSDFALPVGAVVIGELIAVLEGEQQDRNEKQRNDRLIAIPIQLSSSEPMLPMIEFGPATKEAIQQFFVKYNELQGRIFTPIRYADADQAIRLVQKTQSDASEFNSFGL